MRKYILIALAIAFSYGQQVKVTGGFYKGCIGKVDGMYDEYTYHVKCQINNEILTIWVKTKDLSVYK